MGDIGGVSIGGSGGEMCNVNVSMSVIRIVSTRSMRRRRSVRCGIWEKDIKIVFKVVVYVYNEWRVLSANVLGGCSDYSIV